MSLVTATTVFVVVTIIIVVATIEIDTTKILVCWGYIINAFC